MYGSYKTKYIGKTSGFPGFTLRPTIILLNECIGLARIFDWGNPKPQITCFYFLLQRCHFGFILSVRNCFIDVATFMTLFRQLWL